MNKKKIIIALVAVSLIVVVAVLALLLYKSNQNGAGKTPGKENGILPNLPEEISEITTLRVDDINNTTQAKNSYDDYVSRNFEEFPYLEKNGISDAFAPSDRNANLIPLEKFFGSVGASVNQKVKSIAGMNYYALFSCLNENKQKEYGIVFDMSEADLSKTKENVANANEYMRQWEPFLLKDLHTILFPQAGFDENSLNQKLVFKDGKYRYADIDLSSGKSSINYKIAGSPLNLIVVSTSPKCVEKAIFLFEGFD
jgi:hypothetical protein